MPKNNHNHILILLSVTISHSDRNISYLTILLLATFTATFMVKTSKKEVSDTMCYKD